MLFIQIIGHGAPCGNSADSADPYISTILKEIFGKNFLWFI